MTEQETTHLYRSKPCEIEAFQMTHERRRSNADWPQWLHDAWQKNAWKVGSVYLADPVRYAPDYLGRSAPLKLLSGASYLMVSTLEGPIRCPLDSWIIRGVEGELYPCKDSVFQQRWEKAGS